MKKAFMGLAGLLFSAGVFAQSSSLFHYVEPGVYKHKWTKIPTYYVQLNDGSGHIKIEHEIDGCAYYQSKLVASSFEAVSDEYERRFGESLFTVIPHVLDYKDMFKFIHSDEDLTRGVVYGEILYRYPQSGEGSSNHVIDTRDVALYVYGIPLEDVCGPQ